MENVVGMINESLSFLNMWQAVGTILIFVGSLTIAWFGIYLFKRACKNFWTGNHSI